MLDRNFFQFLICAAALLTVLTGPLSVSRGTDGRLAILFAEITEEVEEDGERDDLFEHNVEPIVETIHHIATDTVGSTDTDIPIVCGPHNERGPPVV